MSNIEIYKTADGKTDIDVKLDKETVWLTQKQMCELFQTTKQNISLHVNNIFKEGELKKNSVIKEYLTTAADGKKYSVKYYNLDVIISVGYRIKSQRGTDFRKWATSKLREYIVRGYTLNIKRLQMRQEKLRELFKIVNGLERDTDLLEAKGLLKIISDYYNALVLFDDYDNGKVEKKETIKESKQFTLEEACDVVKELKKKFPGEKLFGKEKDQSFESAIENTYQTFGGRELYPSVESKASHLLYAITKNHAFVDGNKRIAATVFLNYLDKNNLLYITEFRKRIEENTLCALTLMIAESAPSEKEIIESVITNLINMNQIGPAETKKQD